MAHISYDIDISDDTISVNFFGDSSTIDPSYSDAYGLVKLPSYGVIENIDWDRTLYGADTNAAILSHLTSNYGSIEELMLESEVYAD